MRYMKFIRAIDCAISRPNAIELATMVHRGGKWAAYQNQDLEDPYLGQAVYLQYGGERSTYATPPPQFPDGALSGIVGWRYILVGFVDVTTGEILGEEPQQQEPDGQAASFFGAGRRNPRREQA